MTSAMKEGHREKIAASRRQRVAPLLYAHVGAEHEAHFRALIEHSLDAVSLLNREGVILYTTPATTPILGYEQTELLGQSAFAYIHPEDLKRTQALFAFLLTKSPSESITTVLRYRHKNGSWRSLECRGTNLLSEPTVRAVVANFRDVTEQRESQDALKRSEERYRSLVLATSQVVWVTTAEGNVVEDLPTWRTFTGQTREEILGRGWMRALHPDDVERVGLAWAQSLRTKQIHEDEFRVRRADGAYRLLHARGVPILDRQGNVTEWVGTCTDITEKKRHEEELERSVAERTRELRLAQEKDRVNIQRLKAMISKVPMGVIAFDENEVILEVNEHLCEIFELALSVTDMIGRSVNEFAEILRAKMFDEEAYAAQQEKILSEHKPVVGHELWLKDGRILLADYLPIFEDKIYWGQLQLFRDVTQERRIDAAKSEFMSLASHQLRTPLTSIRWTLSRLGRTLEGRANVLEERLLRESKAAATRMAETIDTMLQISRIEHGDIEQHRKDTLLLPLLQDTLILQRENIKRKRQSATIDCPESISVVTDPLLLKEALTNLLSNAVKYTPERGEILLRCSTAGQNVALEITDSGYGIPFHQQGKIFEKFFRGDNILSKETQGTGLGLYLVSLIVHLLGGTITFTSREFRGTTFTLRLPKNSA